jgi:hypothetical protein
MSVTTRQFQLGREIECGEFVRQQSADIIRMLNSAFDEWTDTAVDLYPEDLRPEIDELDEWIYENVPGPGRRAPAPDRAASRRRR